LQEISIDLILTTVYEFQVLMSLTMFYFVNRLFRIGVDPEYKNNDKEIKIGFIFFCFLSVIPIIGLLLSIPISMFIAGEIDERKIQHKSIKKKRKYTKKKTKKPKKKSKD